MTDTINLDSTVDHPPHYRQHPSGVECIQITEHMGFNLGNAVKYVWRADEKGNAMEDLAKARWYIDREIKRREYLANQADTEPLPGPGWPADLMDLLQERLDEPNSEPCICFDGGVLDRTQVRIHKTSQEALKDWQDEVKAGDTTLAFADWLHEDLGEVEDPHLGEHVELRIGDFMPDISIQYRVGPIEDPLI